MSEKYAWLVLAARDWKTMSMRARLAYHRADLAYCEWRLGFLFAGI